MPIAATYRHTNIVARDWTRLAGFYAEVFGCRPLPPQRDYQGDWLERCVGVPVNHVRGIHLLLPGHGESGPTLEIFEYDPAEKAAPPGTHRPGFAHIAFAVDDVEGALAELLEHGGGQLGDVISMRVPGAGHITLVYALDPEGNVVELQKWT